MARLNKILDSGLSQSYVMGEWDNGGEVREALTEKLGFASSNGLYNALRALGWIPGGPVNRKADNDAPAKRSNGKRKGCFPARASVVQCLNKYLNGITDSEDELWIDNPTWTDFKSCRDRNGKDWQSFIVGKCKGQEEIDSFNLWIESNDAADTLEHAENAKIRVALDAAVALIRAHGGEVFNADGDVW